MIAISIYVKGGMAWVMGGSESNEMIHVRLEDADCGEVSYYELHGAEVYEVGENKTRVERIEEALKCLEDNDA